MNKEDLEKKVERLEKEIEIIKKENSKNSFISIGDNRQVNKDEILYTSMSSGWLHIKFKNGEEVSFRIYD